MKRTKRVFMMAAVSVFTCVNGLRAAPEESAPPNQPVPEEGAIHLAEDHPAHAAGHHLSEVTTTAYEFELREDQVAERQTRGALNIVINAGATLAGNAAALAAYNRAAAKWEAQFTDPITVTIAADLQNLGDPLVIGSTNVVILDVNAPYDTFRTVWVASGDADDAILGSLPTAANRSFVLPSGFALSAATSAAKASLKAMGVTGLDGQFGATDATINFNTQFPFDFDNSNGVGAGLTDFETVAAHEIGHALGFFSHVDPVDELLHNGQTATIPPQLMDYLRFLDGSANDPATAANFSTMSRDLRTNVAAITDFIASVGVEAAENRMSTGKFTGDGRQASHWRDDALSGVRLGIMDPSLPVQQVWAISTADLRALDLIGYDVILTLVDCNGNGTPDDQDIASGNSEDCNANGTPDECELISNDCDGDGIPDECELAGNDCNGNGTPDNCELSGNDCNVNGIPDVCELAGNDCNGNGTVDGCELAGNDCNANGRLDECDLNSPAHNCCGTGHGTGCSDPNIQACVCASDLYCCNVDWDGICVEEVQSFGCGSCGAASQDCNDDDTPDECELSGNDCNANATPDDCEVAGNDCNANGSPDECDLPAGHNCCQTLHGTGCSDPDIQACVCASDSFCCEFDWDSICVEEVLSLGCGTCGGASADCNDDGTPDECDTGCFTNNSFETGDFSGWITQDLASPFYPLQVGTAGQAPAGFGFFTSAPTHGSFALLHGWDGDGPGTIRVAQDISIPVGIAAIDFDYRAAWDKANFGDPTQARTFRVLIGLAGGGPVWQDDLILTAPPETANFDTGNLTATVNVSAFAGSPVRIAFEWFVPEFYTGPAFFQLDNVRCVPSCIPTATVVGAVSRKPNPAGPGGVCDLSLLPDLKTDPRQGGITEVRIAFDVPPGDPGANPVTLREATCAVPRFETYTGASTASAVVVGNELVVTFTPALENARLYRILLGPDVTSIAGQSVDVRGLVGDVNSDGLVNATDRSVVVGVWTSPSHFSCGTDLNSNGATNATDRSIVVGAWTGTSNCAP